MAMRIVVVSLVMSWSLRSWWEIEASGHAVLAPADEDGFATDQSFGDLGVAALEHAADGLARDAHRLGGLRMAEPFEVDEADRLQLVDRELQVFEFASGDAGGFEERNAWDTGDGAFDGRARHGVSVSDRRQQ
jgi:hypothetical protein